MSGTFAQRAVSSRTKTIAKGVLGGILAAMLAVAAHSAPLTRVGASGEEHVVDGSRSVDRAKIENLQRWVNAGHETWCRDARLVAMDELRRVAPELAGEASDMEAVSVEEEASAESRAVYAWTSEDGRATYRVTVQRFEWLLPIAGEQDSIVWVPTHVEVSVHR